jgi:hypothetical protein
MKTFRIYAHASTAITMYVHAPNEDLALGRARERLAVDLSPTQYRTVSQPTAIGAWEAERFGVKEPREVADGRKLRVGEVEYCRMRSYDVGYDIDAFHGIQWRHIVDDSVALCRTNSLWGSGGTIDADVRISCPFCLDILHAEMRYPHPELMAYYRRMGNRAVAELSPESVTGKVSLLVNGVEIKSVFRTEGLNPSVYDEAFGVAYGQLRTLCETINKAEAPTPVEPSRPRKELPLARDDNALRATYIALRLQMENAESEGQFVARDVLAERLAAVAKELTVPMREDVEAYFDRDDE